MTAKDIFRTKFDVASIVLIPACIGINYIGKLFASALKLPLWLDSIGTCLGACLGGPIIGGICMKSFPRSIITALVAGAVAIVISTPLNIVFWGGQTGNVWGDAVFAASQAASLPLWLSSLFDEIIVDVPDKIITLILTFLILKALPDKLTSLYDANDEVERLD